MREKKPPLTGRHWTITYVWVALAAIPAMSFYKANPPSGKFDELTLPLTIFIFALGAGFALLFTLAARLLTGDQSVRTWIIVLGPIVLVMGMLGVFG